MALGLNTFRDDSHFHDFGHGDDRNYNRRVVRILFHVANKTLIDFQAIDGEILESTQIAVTRPKVVYRQLHAEVLEGSQYLQNDILIIDQDALG